MSSATLSLLGLMNWDDTILDNLALPDGVDSDIMKNTIMMECAELEILYSQPEFLKQAITIWSDSRLDTWSRLYKAFTMDYNPIWNVDGTETETEVHSNTFTSNSTGTYTDKGSSKGTSNSDGRENNTHSVTGYNSNSLVTESADSNTNSIDVTNTNSSETSGNANNQKNDTDNGTVTRTKKRGGNIGVTMTQQMLSAELDIRPELNIYRYICEEFKNRFCLMIY